MKVYIATSLSNASESTSLMDHMINDGWRRSYDWTEHGSVQSEGYDKIKEIAIAEAKGIKEADLLIALLPGGRGTHVEIGIAIGLMKPVILFGMGEQERFELEADRTCAFYHLPTVVRVGRERGFDGIRTEALKICMDLSNTTNASLERMIDGFSRISKRGSSHHGR